MKIKEGFNVTTIDGNSVVSVDESANISFKGIIILNAAGLDIWNALKNECSYDELIKNFQIKYNVSVDMLKSDIDSFLEKISFALEK